MIVYPGATVYPQLLVFKGFTNFTPLVIERAPMAPCNWNPLSLEPTPTISEVPGLVVAEIANWKMAHKFTVSFPNKNGDVP